MSFVSGVQSIGTAAGAQGAFFGNPKVGVGGGLNSSALAGRNAFNTQLPTTSSLYFGRNLGGNYQYD